MNDENKVVGDIDILVEKKGVGLVDVISFRNTVLTLGKEAIAKSLAGEIGSAYDFHICKMLFGTNGTDGGGTPKVIDPDRTSLFGPTLITKNVSALVDPNVRGRVIFTAVLLYADANGSALNEFALQMYNGDLYSMATRGSVYKDSDTQLTFLWRVTQL